MSRCGGYCVTSGGLARGSTRRKVEMLSSNVRLVPFARGKSSPVQQGEHRVRASGRSCPTFHAVPDGDMATHFASTVGNPRRHSLVGTSVLDAWRFATTVAHSAPVENCNLNCATTLLWLWQSQKVAHPTNVSTSPVVNFEPSASSLPSPSLSVGSHQSGIPHTVSRACSDHRLVISSVTPAMLVWSPLPSSARHEVKLCVVLQGCRAQTPWFWTIARRNGRLFLRSAH